MPANIGVQNITIRYYTVANSLEVNRRHVSIRLTGIYSGGYLSIVDNANASLSVVVCEIGDGTHQVRAETTVAVTIGVALATPYVVLRWAYTGAITDYMQILAVATPAANDLVVAKCTFTGGGNLQGFDYEDSSYPRSTPNVQDLFLKVQPTENTELKVRIRAGHIQKIASSIDISDQKSDLFVVPSANSRVYLVYIDTSNGTVNIDSTGTEAASPAAPDYKGKLVLAEVTLASTSTNITAGMIKDVRNFITAAIEPDDTTIEVGSNGKLAVKDGSIGNDQLGTITSLFGSWTDKDSLNNALAQNNVYKPGSDGFVVVPEESTGGLNYHFYTDSSNPPTTDRYNQTQVLNGASAWRAPAFQIPVKKNDYWKVTGTSGTIYWLPIGHGTCVKQ